jgi:hypothetical protein
VWVAAPQDMSDIEEGDEYTAKEAKTSSLPQHLADPAPLCYGEEIVLEAINLFCSILEEKGADPNILDAALETFAEKMQKEGESMYATCNFESVQAERERYYDSLRKDYWGRALFFHMERFFPKERNAERRILSSPMPGMLPRQILQGLIDLIKNTRDAGLIAQYERLFTSKSTKYRRKADGVVDMVAFANDGEVRSVAVNLIRGFRRDFEAQPEAERKAWLTGHIQKTAAYGAMQRDLSDEEYRLIVENVFGV